MAPPQGEGGGGTFAPKCLILDPPLIKGNVYMFVLVLTITVTLLLGDTTFSQPKDFSMPLFLVYYYQQLTTDW